MAVLDRLNEEHSVPIELYSSIKKNITSNFIKEVKSVSDFVAELPLTLRTKLTVHIYKEIYSKLDFLKNQSPPFLSWIFPLL